MCTFLTSREVHLSWNICPTPVLRSGLQTQNRQPQLPKTFIAPTSLYSPEIQQRAWSKQTTRWRCFLDEYGRQLLRAQDTPQPEWTPHEPMSREFDIDLMWLTDSQCGMEWRTNYRHNYTTSTFLTYNNKILPKTRSHLLIVMSDDFKSGVALERGCLPADKSTLHLITSMISFHQSLQQRVGMNIICQADTCVVWQVSFVSNANLHFWSQSATGQSLWLRVSCSYGHFLNSDLNGFKGLSVPTFTGKVWHQSTHPKPECAANRFSGF